MLNKTDLIKQLTETISQPEFIFDTLPGQEPVTVKQILQETDYLQSIITDSELNLTVTDLQNSEYFVNFLNTARQNFINNR